MSLYSALAKKIMTLPRPLKPPDLYAECCHCKEKSPHIYTQGWACLNPECIAFWKMENGHAEGYALEYTDRFLALVPSPRNLDVCLIPRYPTMLSSKGTMRSYRFCKGWHCVQCGRLSCRYRLQFISTRISLRVSLRFKWEHWECSNCGVRFVR